MRSRASKSHRPFREQLWPEPKPQAAAHAGTWSTMLAGAAGLVVGMFLAIAIGTDPGGTRLWLDERKQTWHDTERS
jgi:hypothetical protein